MSDQTVRGEGMTRCADGFCSGTQIVIFIFDLEMYVIDAIQGEFVDNLKKRSFFYFHVYSDFGFVSFHEIRFKQGPQTRSSQLNSNNRFISKIVFYVLTVFIRVVFPVREHVIY